MAEPPSTSSVSRRNLLRAGGLAGGLAAGAPLFAGVSSAEAQVRGPAAEASATSLPVSEIEDILRATGTVSNGVLNIEIDRDDLPNVRKHGVPVKPSFEINGNLCFQAGPAGGIMMNGDLAFKDSELNPAIDAMIKHGITWQAQHQHLFDLDPMVWFMHMRARGPARTVAEGLASVLAVTSTPLPQAPPAHPRTSLNVQRLERIIGAPAMVGSDGVVGFQIARRNPISLDGVRISSYLNVYTSVNFEPRGGHLAAVVPDFGMVAHEIPGLTGVMREQGWEVDCLYNQETAENPQLYFSHHWKVGDAYRLAGEVRRGLEKLNVVLSRNPSSPQ